MTISKKYFTDGNFKTETTSTAKCLSQNLWSSSSATISMTRVFACYIYGNTAIRTKYQIDFPRINLYSPLHPWYALRWTSKRTSQKMEIYVFSVLRHVICLVIDSTTVFFKQLQNIYSLAKRTFPFFSFHGLWKLFFSHKH